MTQTIVKFRSKIDRERDVDLLAKYREIGIAAIAAANQAFRGNDKKTSAEPRRVVGYVD